MVDREEPNPLRRDSLDAIAGFGPRLDFRRGEVECQVRGGRIGEGRVWRQRLDTNLLKARRFRRFVEGIWPERHVGIGLVFLAAGQSIWSTARGPFGEG